MPVKGGAGAKSAFGSPPLQHVILMVTSRIVEWTKNDDLLRSVDEFSSFHPPSGQKLMKTGARLSMAVDVLAMLIMVVFIGALLLAPSRRDGKAQH